MEVVRRDLEVRMQKVRDDEAKEAAIEADKMAKEKEREDRLKDREERLKQREDAIAQRAIEETRAKEEAEKAREFRAQKRLVGESATASGTSTPTGKAGKSKSSAAKAEQSEEEEEEEDWELACEVCKQHGWNVVSGFRYGDRHFDFLNAWLCLYRMTAAISHAVRVVVDGNIPTATTSMTIDSDVLVAIGTRLISIAQIVVNVLHESEIRMAIKRSDRRLPLVKQVRSRRLPRSASACPTLHNSRKARQRQADRNRSPPPKPMVGCRPHLRRRRRRLRSSRKSHECLRTRKLPSSQNCPNPQWFNTVLQARGQRRRHRTTANATRLPMAADHWSQS